MFSSRRHLSELNQTEKKFSSLSRENRLNSLERENNKLLSPEKVLSLRRNSADPNQPTSQPLSSLMKSSRDEERSTTSKMSNHIHESKMSLNLSTNHLEPRSISPSKLSERIESRASIDNASNVKGKNPQISKSKKFTGIIEFCVDSERHEIGCHSIPSRFVGRSGQNRCHSEQ